MTAREKFIKLIGEGEIKALEKNNWIDYEIKNNTYYPGNQIAIRFLEKDGKRDTVIFCEVIYSEDEKKWWSENPIDEEDHKFDTYQQMADHYETLDDEHAENNSSFAEL